MALVSCSLHDGFFFTLIRALFKSGQYAHIETRLRTHVHSHVYTHAHTLVHIYTCLDPCVYTGQFAYWALCCMQSLLGCLASTLHFTLQLGLCALTCLYLWVWTGARICEWTCFAPAHTLGSGARLSSYLYKWLNTSLDTCQALSVVDTCFSQFLHACSCTRLFT